MEIQQNLMKPEEYGNEIIVEETSPAIKELKKGRFTRYFH